MLESRSLVGDGLYRDCLLCGLRVRRYTWPGAAITQLCRPCQVRVEAEISFGVVEPCSRCGRHPDLCARTPCAAMQRDALSLGSDWIAGTP